MSDTDKVVCDAHRDDCLALADTLTRIGDKWTVMVIGALTSGVMRYSQIHRFVKGISQRMLTLTLKGLERDGFVFRKVYPTIPPRVEYELTELGQTLVVPLRALQEWAVKHRPAMLAARERFARRSDSRKVDDAPGRE